jgi:hypothetical protein
VMGVEANKKTAQWLAVGDFVGVLEHGMREERLWRTRETRNVPRRGAGVGRYNQKGGQPRAWRESDHCIVLGDGRTDHKGKAVTGSCSSQRKHDADKMDRYLHANLPARDSK